MFAAAVAAGVPPLEAWELTPREVGLWCESMRARERAASEERVTLAYLTAYWAAAWWSRQPPPPLEEILGRRERRSQTDEEMLAAVRALNAALGGVDRGGSQKPDNPGRG